MEHLINPLVKDVQISGIRKFYNMVADIEGTISLTIGQPDFPTPTHIKEAAKQAINNDYTVYTHNAGYLELREAASNYVKDKYKLDYDPANEVIVTSGASEGIDIAFRTILIPGNEVILPGPVYPGYEPIIKMCGATPVYADTTKNGFRLTADILEKYITENTRCIVLPYPSNPTGVTLTAEELLDIAELVRGKDIFILADEIYSELVFDQEHVSIATFLKEQTIVLNGLSKSHSMTGWRIGLLFAPAAISQHLLKVHQYNVTCAASISQRAALEALTAGRNDAIPMKTEYARRREYVYSRLQAMKLEIVKPNGAFYFFIKLPEGYASSLDFCLKLVQQEKVAVVPGDAFSPLGEGYFRISYAYSMETLEKALDRIEAFLAKK
ncbi:MULTISPECIES: aminotransferase A [Peribacillus]|jgi:aminotransferase|uniref:aminotransferase A n=1 Tax=Peribacillus TaxID=2675229 RepID=UPI000BA7824B|nr:MULTISPECIES: aminotransferase A [Peribacillus]MCZ0872378.1 aminotransferase A [Peribacillus sp. AS_2]MED3891963.1 aminotransferase A [Peribacillus frigoritolerans]MED4694010.1 aminotransferase A [Peribacillus frigoritolerans]PAK44358.1 aromatic amino acid aminotransferase [Peribacillus simplex]PAW28025.1 aromatic amino acid aminotransferase [Peribacillus simplex]